MTATDSNTKYTGGARCQVDTDRQTGLQFVWILAMLLMTNHTHVKVVVVCPSGEFRIEFPEA